MSVPRVEDTNVRENSLRWRNAYSFYMKDCSVRERLQREQPDWTFGQISKAFGSQWKQLSEHQKDPYIKQSNKEKVHVKASTKYDDSNA